MARTISIEQHHPLHLKHLFLPSHNFFAFSIVHNVSLLSQETQFLTPRAELKQKRNSVAKTTSSDQCFSPVAEVAYVIQPEHVAACVLQHSKTHYIVERMVQLRVYLLS